jgi:hypothetical protein
LRTVQAVYCAPPADVSARRLGLTVRLSYNLKHQSNKIKERLKLLGHVPGIRETIKLRAMQKLSMYASVIQKVEMVCCAKDGVVEATISFRLNLATRGMTVERILVCVEPTLLSYAHPPISGSILGSLTRWMISRTLPRLFALRWSFHAGAAWKAWHMLLAARHGYARTRAKLGGEVCLLVVVSPTEMMIRTWMHRGRLGVYGPG